MSDAAAMRERISRRVAGVRRVLIERELPALLVTRIENVRWLTGFTGSNGFALITDSLALFATDSRYVERAKTECPGFEQVKLETSAPDEIAGILGKAETDRIAFEADHLTVRLHEVYQEKMPEGTTLVPATGIIEDLRIVKDESEIDLIEQACAIADCAFTHILPFLRPGSVELDIVLELEWFLRKVRRVGLAFDTAVASGPNGALPHAKPGERAFRKGDFVTLDFGARVGGYCSDITRTVVLGQPTTEQRRVYQTVLNAQEIAFDHITSGASGRDVDKLARDLIGEAGYGDFFGHGLGHSLGLAVHDGQGFSKRSELTLAPNMVMTVEPGIYIPGWGGARVEDDVVVTAGTPRVLTHSSRELLVL